VLPVLRAQEVDTVVSSQDLEVDSSPEVGALQEMALLVALDPGRIAPLVVSDAVAAEATEPCRMLGLARENTSRKRHISMLDMAATSDAPEGTSLASSQVVAFLVCSC